MNKIVFVIWRDQPGGIEVFLPEIINRLNDYSFEVFVLREKSNTNSVFQETPVKVQYGNSRNWHLYRKLFRYAIKNRHKIFHLFNSGPVVLLILKLAGARKIIYSIHGTIYWRTIIQKIVRKVIWALAIDQHIIFIANSNWSRCVFLKQVNKKTNIQVLYNPINNYRFQFYQKTNSQLQNIIYAGRLAKGKNLIKWLECVRNILSIYPEICFIVYGDGPLKDFLIQYAAKLGISQHVKFYGFIKNIENAYQEADLLLFLSEYESFGNVVIESILCGTPVIASRIPSMEEIFQNFPQFLIPLDNNLDKNILEKLQRYDELKRLTLKASLEFRERFSIEQHINQLDKIYKNVLQ